MARYVRPNSSPPRCPCPSATCPSTCCQLRFLLHGNTSPHLSYPRQNISARNKCHQASRYGRPTEPAQPSPSGSEAPQQRSSPAPPKALVSSQLEVSAPRRALLPPTASSPLFQRSE